MAASASPPWRIHGIGLAEAVCTAAGRQFCGVAAPREGASYGAGVAAPQITANFGSRCSLCEGATNHYVESSRPARMAKLARVSLRKLSFNRRGFLRTRVRGER